MQKIIVIGASVMDVLMKSSEFKVLKSHEVAGGVALCEVVGGKIEAEQGEMISGGGGSNVAVGLLRLGHAVKLISKVGNDRIGGLLLEELKELFLDTSMVQKGKGKTGVSTVLINSAGNRSIVTYRGESLKIDIRDIDWGEVKKADWVQISSLGGRMDLLEEIVDFAFVNGIKIGLNPGKSEIESDRLWKILSKIDLLSLNRFEASVLCSVDFEKEGEIYKKISEAGARTVAVTDGKRGATLIRSGKWYKMDTFSNLSVDDTGAGDAFVSGLVGGALTYVNDIVMLKMGLANGSSVVAKMGAKCGLLQASEMKKWLSKKLKMVEGWV